MTLCEHCDDDLARGECAVHVECDKDCRALLDPLMPGTIFRAYVHWRWHPRTGGCSHGC